MPQQVYIRLRKIYTGNDFKTMGVNKSMCLVDRHQTRLQHRESRGLFGRGSLAVIEHAGVSQKRLLGRRQAALTQAKGLETLVYENSQFCWSIEHGEWRERLAGQGLTTFTKRIIFNLYEKRKLEDFMKQSDSDLHF